MKGGLPGFRGACPPRATRGSRRNMLGIERAGGDGGRRASTRPWTRGTGSPSPWAWPAPHGRRRFQLRQGTQAAAPQPRLPPGSHFPHPATGRPLRTYEGAERPGRHLNFFQFECCVKADVPRVDAESSCPERHDHRRGGPRHRRESAEGLERPGPGRGQRPGSFLVVRRVALDLQRAKGRGPCGRGRRDPRRAGRGAGSRSRRPCGGSRRPGG